MAELEPRNFLQPCLLLLLRESPDHGYELAARLRPMHDGDGDAGGIYRALRGLERQGLVCSEWHTSPTGPARRIYCITEEGVAALDVLVTGLEQTHASLHVFLDRYARLAASGRNEQREGGVHDLRTHPRARHDGVLASDRPDGQPVRGGS
jgi:PadR family transcriptional regulator, regulatory protein PadR